MRWASRSVTEALGGASLLNHVEVIPHNKHGPEQRKLSLSPCMTYIVNLLDDYTSCFFSSFFFVFALGWVTEALEEEPADFRISSGGGRRSFSRGTNIINDKMQVNK